MMFLVFYLQCLRVAWQACNGIRVTLDLGYNNLPILGLRPHCTAQMIQKSVFRDFTPQKVRSLR